MYLHGDKKGFESKGHWCTKTFDVCLFTAMHCLIIQMEKIISYYDYYVYHVYKTKKKNQNQTERREKKSSSSGHAETEIVIDAANDIIMNKTTSIKTVWYVLFFISLSFGWNIAQTA